MRDISASVQFTGGTTELTITPLIPEPSRPAMVNKFRVNTPYSSTVCSRAVVNRQFAINSSPRNTPNTVFVFPTSMVSSIVPAHLKVDCVDREKLSRGHRD